jgi:hypothetical protein
MLTELLSHSPLLAAPIVAMFIFLTVFLAVLVRVAVRPQHEIDAAAKLPLDACDPEGIVDDHK